MEPVVVNGVTIGGAGGTCVMGVLNVTPDSFSDGGRYVSPSAAAMAGLALVRAGAHILDVGGESTRPDAAPVAAADEAARVLPVIRALRAAGCAAAISIDTVKAEVADAALAAGADIVNDVAGGAHDPDLLRVVARRGAVVVLGHLRGAPGAGMMKDVAFVDVVAEVGDELWARVAAARAAGVAPGRIVIDPGLGFGKLLEHNLALIQGLGALRARVGRPVLVGPSRKRFLGELTGIAEPAARDFPTAAAITACILAGADAVRVHAVAELVAVVKVADALRKAAPGHAYQGAA
ncbi:MAG: dihydropteroate synthase [Deltaproteobacteria bacterium]|nr:dihydropteroate synthase [Deltaproteobacteria bacterium]